MIHYPPPTIAEARAKIVEVTQATLVEKCKRGADHRIVRCTASGGPQLINYPNPVRMAARRGPKGNWKVWAV